MAQSGEISITPLLKRLWPKPDVTASEVALAVSHIFTGQLSAVQTGALLTALHFTGWDHRADVIAACARAMRDASCTVDEAALRGIVEKRGRKEGSYRGGFCDIVGTGGDSHSTFNISTTSSILASSLLLLSKHGNRASTSKSGSADLLTSIAPTPANLEAITSQTITRVYERTNYAFLYAPVFHPGMKHAAPVRKALGWRTIFNLLGPLANPAESVLEARVVGVARKDLGPVFADALKMEGAKKAMVVCGEEDLDEISCAGPTLCWRLVPRPSLARAGSDESEISKASNSSDDEEPREHTSIEHFTLSPADFGLPAHPLSAASPGKSPAENAHILMRLLNNELPPDDPILHFVLMNTAALFVISGICDADTSNMGPDDTGEVVTEKGPGGGRWKEGVRRARWAVASGEAMRMLQAFIQASNSV